MQTSKGGYQVSGSLFLYIRFLNLYNKISVLISNINTAILLVQDSIMVGT